MPLDAVDAAVQNEANGDISLDGLGELGRQEGKKGVFLPAPDEAGYWILWVQTFGCRKVVPRAGTTWRTPPRGSGTSPL